MGLLRSKIWRLLLELWAGKLSKVSNLSKIDNCWFLVSDLIMELDPNHDGKVTHEEFILVMKYIE